MRFLFFKAQIGNAYGSLQFSPIGLAVMPSLGQQGRDLLQEPNHERPEGTISTISGVFVVLHCLWCPRSKQAGGFFLWAESSAKSGNHKKSSRGKASDYFPYLASPTDLLKFLRSVFPSQLKDTPKTKTLSLFIPTIKEGESLASSTDIRSKL